MKYKLWIAGLLVFAPATLGRAEKEALPTLVVLDFSIPAAESNRWAWP